MALALRRGLTGAVTAVTLALVAFPATAQQTDASRPMPVLLLDSDAAFGGSELGRSITAEIEAAGNALASENRRIEAELIEEEKRLTEQRSQLDPDEFRTLADAFDEKVRRIRSEQDGKARALAQQGEDGRRKFLIAARPVLEQIMIETGAAVILETRSVFLGDQSVNITAEVIRRLDDTVAGPDQDAPDTGPQDSTPEAPQSQD